MRVFGEATGAILRAIGRCLVEATGSPERLPGYNCSARLCVQYSHNQYRFQKCRESKAIPKPSLYSCGNFLFHERFYSDFFFIVYFFGK